jgi:hypothetical protein
MFWIFARSLYKHGSFGFWRIDVGDFEWYEVCRHGASVPRLRVEVCLFVHVCTGLSSKCLHTARTNAHPQIPAGKKRTCTKLLAQDILDRRHGNRGDHIKDERRGHVVIRYESPADQFALKINIQDQHVICSLVAHTCAAD